MYVNPFVIFLIEPFFIMQLFKNCLYLLKLLIFDLEMLPLLACCLGNRSIDKQIQFFGVPERYDIDFLWKMFGHKGPNAVFINRKKI